MARIAWIEDDAATGETADLYRELERTSTSGRVPNILRTMSLRPDFLRAIDQAALSPKHRLLLEFVETLTRHAYRITDEQVNGLRRAGWTDAQIAEAVYEGALFNLFVRLADAFDIHPDPAYDAGGIPRVLSQDEG